MLWKDRKSQGSIKYEILVKKKKEINKTFNLFLLIRIRIIKSFYA